MAENLPPAWRSAITTTDDENIWIRGHNVTDLMQQQSFADVVYLLHQGNLPTRPIQKLINAILIAGADHGANSPSALAARTVASGNRRGLEAAIAAGVLAIGDVHGGAGFDCLEMIAYGVLQSQREGITLEDSAANIINDVIKTGRRIPGLGRITQVDDSRTTTLFQMAQEAHVASHGVAFMCAVEKSAHEHIAYLPINVDGAIAAVLYDLGFPPAFAKAIFIIARVAGLSAQVMEEYTREQPMRIQFPVDYDGPRPQNRSR